MLDAFLDHLPPNPVVVEGGAYDGADTLRLAARCGFVHAFEPVSFYQLCDTVAHRRNVKSWRYALGDRDGEQEMWVSGGPLTASSSLLAPKDHLRVLPEITFGPRITVTVTSLAAWSRVRHIGPVDGLWLDLQGMELTVLKAAGQVLDSVKAMVLEVSHTELYDGCPLWPEVERWLVDQGFVVEQVVPEGEHQSNVLAVR